MAPSLNAHPKRSEKNAMKILRKLLAALLHPSDRSPRRAAPPRRRDEDDRPDSETAAEEDSRKPAHFIPFPRY